MPITRTYAVGDNAAVVRLDNLTGTWTDVSISLPVGALLDVETDPLTADKVFVVGQGDGDFGTYGIYVSSDAGVTWSVPTGTYQTNVIPVTNRVTYNEVHCINSTTIYAVGDYGFLVRSTDSGLTFDLATQLPIVSACPTCNPQVQTGYSLHFIDDQIGVVGTETHVFKTIDGGTTWTTLNSGNPIFYSASSSNKINGIHISADEQTIVLTCLNGVYLSTDAGVTFTLANTLNGKGTHLTWYDDSNLYAFGQDNQILKTVNGGITWTVVRALAPSSPTNNYLAGHYYSLQNGFFGGGKYINYTTDGSVTSVISLGPPTNNFVFYALWTGFFPPSCYELLSCTGEFPAITVSNDLSAIVGQFIQICPENMPTNQINPPSGIPFSIPQTGSIASYRLEDCCGDLPDIIISGYDLSPYSTSNSIIQITQIPGRCWKVKKAGAPVPPPYDLSGTITGYSYANCSTCNQDFTCQVIPIITKCGCFEVTETTNCENVIELVGIETVTPFTNCEFCIAQRDTPCYLLTDCDNPQHTIITSDDLSNYVDQVIQIKSCPDYCFTVSLSESCLNAISVLPITANFTTCELCNPQPVIPTNLITRRVKPGYDTPACPPAYTEKVNCTFGEAMYLEVIAKRYGIEDCCDIDVPKWTIKKELLDIKVLEDPNFITPTKKCYCYTIEQISEIVTYKYIDCEGCLISLEITPGNTEYICSQSYPKPYCPPDNAVYSITPSTTICTTNADCQPPPCNCYKVINSNKDGAVISYTDCESGQTIQKSLPYLLETFFCVDGDITIVSAEDPQLVSIENLATVCTVQDNCRPCTCYEVISPSEQTVSLFYYDCNYTQVNVQFSGTIYVCAIPGTFESVSRLSINELGDCDNANCNTQCFCFILSNLDRFNPATYSYISCETGETVAGILDPSGVITGCAKQGSIQHSGTVSLELNGSCQTDLDCLPCQCLQFINTQDMVSVTVNYVGCNGVSYSEIIPALSAKTLCVKDYTTTGQLNIVTVDATCTSGPSGVFKCSAQTNCVTIENDSVFPGTDTVVQYVNSSDNVIEVTIPYGTYINDCMSYFTVISGSFASYNGLPCLDAGDCSISCTCLTVTVLTSGSITYAPCSNPPNKTTTVNYTNPGTYYICAQNLGWSSTGDITIVNSGISCTGDGDCNF